MGEPCHSRRCEPELMTHPRYMIRLSDLAALAVRNVLHRKDAKFAKFKFQKLALRSLRLSG